MRFISMHKTNKNNEAGVPPTPELITKMGALIGEMVAAGVFVAGEGLGPSSKGVRVRFSDGKRTVTKGPLTGENELVAALSIVKVKSIEEAIEWSSRFARVAGDVEVDIRPIHEPWDIGVMPKPEGVLTRFMIAQKADRNSEAGVATAPEWGSVVDEMTKAGVLLASERIQPSSKGMRFNFSKGQRTITDGPFAESKELIAGYSILQLDSIDDSIGWITKFARVLGDVEVDVRPLYEPAVR